MKKFTFALKKIPTLVAMRTKQQVVKCCPPAFAGMTIAFLAAMALTACLGGSTSEPTRYFTLAVENGGLRISDNTATHTAKCMKVKITSAPEGASVTCGTGMLKNALRAGGDSVELRFLNGGLDPIRVSTVKGWQVVFMPVSEKAESKEDTAPGENDAPEDAE